MAWHLVGIPRTVRITKALAKEWADKETAHVDRPKSDIRSDRHSRTLKKNRFRPLTWAECYCKQVKKTIRLDGNHTSNLFSSVNLKEQQTLYVTIQKFECDTLEDVADLYSTFDSRDSVRTSLDVNRAYAAGIPALDGVSIKVIGLIVGGIAYHLWSGHDARKYSLADRADLLYHNVDFAAWFASLGPASGYAALLQRVPVAAAVYATYRKNKVDAVKFWTAVRDDTGRSPALPDRKLNKFLSMHRLEKGSHSTPKRYRLSHKEFYTKCIVAWNLWRQKKKGELTYRHTAPIPDPV